MKITLPRVRYHREIDEKEMVNLLEDAACIYSTVSNYDVIGKAYLVGGQDFSESYFRMQSGAIIFILRMYHFVSQLLDISDLMKPMVVEVTDPGMTVVNATKVMSQAAISYTHYIEGRDIVLLADLYRILPLLGNLLYGTISDAEILENYKTVVRGLVDDYLNGNVDSRLGELVDIGDRN